MSICLVSSSMKSGEDNNGEVESTRPDTSNSESGCFFLFLFLVIISVNSSNLV